MSWEYLILVVIGLLGTYYGMEAIKNKEPPEWAKEDNYYEIGWLAVVIGAVFLLGGIFVTIFGIVAFFGWDSFGLSRVCQY